jgi:predicted nucleic-acid-binding Zn-ribbon protein
MKKTLTCPKCDGRQILHVDQMKLPSYGQGAIGAKPYPVPITVQQSFWRGTQAIGAFETFICRACGYTEWYAGDPAAIPVDEASGIRLLDNSPKATLR